VETDFHLDLDWVCLKESTFFAKLSLIYPTVTFISWEIVVNLPPVNFLFCSQWIPPLTHAVWKYEMLEVLLAAVNQLRFIKVLDWVAVPITIKHSDVGGFLAMERVVRAFIKTKDMVVNLKTKKRPARSVASICKDHHYGIEVPVQESRRRLIPWFMKLAVECITEMGCIPGMSIRLLCLCCGRVDRNPAGASGDCRPGKS
jgi:hypothetical protein